MLLDDGTAAFVCVACVSDARVEARQAKAADPEHPRLWLVTHLGWRGGW